MIDRSLVGVEQELQPIPNHLRYVLGEAQRAFERGSFQEGLTNLCHSVFVAGTEGRGELSEMDLIRELRKVAGFGFDVGDRPCP